jgi:hypothetical protein
VVVGEVSFEDGDVFGRPVVEAARLVSAAEGGQILATQAVRLVSNPSRDVLPGGRSNPAQTPPRRGRHLVLRSAGMRLDGLSEEGVADYLAEAAGRDLHENDIAVARPIHGETQGNPFFVREVVRHLVETGAFVHQDGRWRAVPSHQIGIPEGVREVVGRRLSRLSETCIAVLRTAAVIGMEFELPVVQAAAGLDEDDVIAAIDEAMAARLVSESSAPALRFRMLQAALEAEGTVETTRRARLLANPAVEVVYADDRGRSGSGLVARPGDAGLVDGAEVVTIPDVAAAGRHEGAVGAVELAVAVPPVTNGLVAR